MAINASAAAIGAEKDIGWSSERYRRGTASGSMEVAARSYGTGQRKIAEFGRRALSAAC